MCAHSPLSRYCRHSSKYPLESELHVELCVASPYMRDRARALVVGQNVVRSNRIKRTIIMPRFMCNGRAPHVHEKEFAPKAIDASNHSRLPG